jgi:hypothetical protein
MQVRAIIAALGGLSEAARQLNAPVTTVQWWRDNDRVPHWREPQVRAACERAGIDPETGKRITTDA